ncbi:MAG: diguanylate cyclase [Myxococcales bacterium FL481]|nr:MAG: diguanylate cyclase [Myxococcales bacterium FL481]
MRPPSPRTSVSSRTHPVWERRFTHPIAAVGARPRPAADTLSTDGRRSPGGAMKTARILVVDDDKTMLSAVSNMVAEAGYTPLCAMSWGEALRVFRQDPPDMVLLDVMMPDIDGFKLARMFKNEADRIFVPVILITALDDLASKQRGLAAGADDFLTKPINPLELDLRIKAMLRVKVLTDQIQSARQQLAKLAVTDELTGIANRRSLNEALEREFTRAVRYKHPFSVCLLDIDRFKAVNDNHGHAVGDRVLVLAAGVLSDCVRRTDLVGRFGGEEFLILAPETSPTDARVLAERVRTTLERRSQEEQDLPDVTASIGIAGIRNCEISDAATVVRLADEALYEAKASGRNRCILASTRLTVAEEAEATEVETTTPSPTVAGQSSPVVRTAALDTKAHGHVNAHVEAARPSAATDADPRTDGCVGAPATGPAAATDANPRTDGCVDVPATGPAAATDANPETDAVLDAVPGNAEDPAEDDVNVGSDTSRSTGS